MNNVWKKRLMKLKGAGWFLYSSTMLRFTAFNKKRLEKEIVNLEISKLHVGCGNVLLPGWLNITFDLRQEYGRIQDKNGAKFLNFNLLQSWPVMENSVSFIAGSHFIEHLDLNCGIKFLKECHRVMKKEGVIRLSCPDLEIYAKNYVNNNASFFNHHLIREWCTFKNAQTPGEIFIAKAYDSGGSHKWFYDFASLKHILELTGFKNVQRCGRLEGKTPDIEKLEPPERELETVYVEAVKG